ncbi:MAG: 7-carboxy-7-deazaguanine synthase [Candidatus Sabulitectum sp.]|nr:7-carboxy-7-deazaguanine synthase [Candidatus Sabulitectum sp.]
MSDKYRVKEMVLTLQGEGAMAGTPVVLLRFEGCNLSCDFCDTDFTGTDGIGGGIFTTPGNLADAIEEKWISDTQVNILCTGGEPLLQLDPPLIKELRARSCKILLETNGTLKAPDGIHWICVSPKTNTIPLQNSGDEIKIVWPQKHMNPETFKKLNFNHFWIQPIFDKNYNENLETSIEYCLTHPGWRLSLQTHRFTGLP